VFGNPELGVRVKLSDGSKMDIAAEVEFVSSDIGLDV